MHRFLSFIVIDIIFFVSSPSSSSSLEVYVVKSESTARLTVGVSFILTEIINSLAVGLRMYSISYLPLACLLFRDMASLISVTLLNN
jgi:hypothetical protein